MEKILNFWSKYWRLVFVGFFVAIVAYVLLFRGISTLTGGYASAELSSQQQSASLRYIYENPVNAPYKLLVWGALKLDHHSLAVTRIAAALFAVMVAVLFYWVALHWYSKRVALLSTLLFISSSGFLHIGRNGSGLILQMATLVLIACVLLYRRVRQETAVAYIIALVLATCLYIPGMIWFELIGLVIMRKRIASMFSKLGHVHTWVIFILGTVPVLPLLWVGVRDVSILREVSGLPATLLSPLQLLDNALHLGSSVVYRGYWPTDHWMYGAPLLNLGEAILLLAGLLVLVRRPILRGNYFLIGTLLTATALIVLGGSVSIAMLIPLVYLTIAGGVYYLLDQWLEVFPRNPFARFIGVALILLLAGCSVFYHLKAYYTAWPNAPETKVVYSVKQPS
ncbi:hypothetical protein KA016_04125 [Candidatus Saccharibacteria bacterium]|nr:hypothetical protein [Candidatus Saccharibacteria bacterium]